jgi:hypothetical protein
MNDNKNNQSFRLSEKELEKEFNNLLLEALDDSLSALGASIKEALYFHLEKSFSVKKDTICEDPEKLSDGLAKIFGLGSKFIEKMIIDFIINRTGCKLSPDFQKQSFGESIKQIKRIFIMNRIAR